MGYNIYNIINEIIIEDTYNKNITYYNKSNLSVSAIEGNVNIYDSSARTPNSSTPIFSQNPANIDLPAADGLYDLVTTIHGYITTVSPDGFSGGWADYADTATTGTPINVTATPAVLTNKTSGELYAVLST